MSVVVNSLLLFVIVIVVCLVIITVSKKQTQLKTAEILSRFNEAGIKYNLSFSSQEILATAVIGLDGLHHKLLLFNTGNHKNKFELIELKTVTKCAVIKTFRSIAIDEWKGKNLDEYYEKIELHFTLAGKKDPVTITFYDNVHNHFFEVPELEQKAKYWETILSKISHQNQKKIA